MVEQHPGAGTINLLEGAPEMPPKINFLGLTSGEQNRHFQSKLDPQGTIVDCLPPTCEAPGYRYFDAPPLQAHRCVLAVLAIGMGLVMWVGIWDLVEDHLLPALSSVLLSKAEPTNSSYLSLCHQTSSYGVEDTRLICFVTRFSLVLIGFVGLYITRTLYGLSKYPAAQFQRLL